MRLCYSIRRIFNDDNIHNKNEVKIETETENETENDKIDSERILQSQTKLVDFKKQRKVQKTSNNRNQENQ